MNVDIKKKKFVGNLTGIQIEAENAEEALDKFWEIVDEDHRALEVEIKEKKKKKYRVSWMARVVVEVEANTLEEAIDTAEEYNEEADQLPLDRNTVKVEEVKEQA